MLDIQILHAGVIQGRSRRNNREMMKDPILRGFFEYNLYTFGMNRKDRKELSANVEFLTMFEKKAPCEIRLSCSLCI